MTRTLLHASHTRPSPPPAADLLEHWITHVRAAAVQAHDDVSGCAGGHFTVTRSAGVIECVTHDLFDHGDDVAGSEPVFPRDGVHVYAYRAQDAAGACSGRELAPVIDAALDDLRSVHAAPEPVVVVWWDDACGDGRAYHPAPTPRARAAVTWIPGQRPPAERVITAARVLTRAGGEHTDIVATFEGETDERPVVTLDGAPRLRAGSLLGLTLQDARHRARRAPLIH